MFEPLTNNDKKAYAFIRNRIINGFETPTLEEINKIIQRSSPRSAVLALQRLEKAGLIKRVGRSIKLTNESMTPTNSISTIKVPLVGSVAAGVPILAEENIEAMIPIATALARPGSNYFLLRVSGNSMNQATVNGVTITDGSIVLVRKQETADHGSIVVALINDSATVKVLELRNGLIILKPKSSLKEYTPIVLSDSCTIQGVVIAVLPEDLY